MNNQIYGKIQVTIKGLTPLLMNRLTMDSLESKSKNRFQTYNQKDEAKKSAYLTEIDGKQTLYVPNYAIYSMIINTAKMYKAKRMSISSILAGAIRIEPEYISLGTDKYEIDSRAVVIVGSRVIKSRAKIPEWQITFDIIYNKRVIQDDNSIATIKTILEDAGTRMGLLDYRPQHKGWFGTFEVTNFTLED